MSWKPSGKALRGARVLAALLALLALPALQLAALPVQAAGQIHKCTIDGTVTFQRDPCPSDGPRRQPSARELNARRQQRLRQAGEAGPGASAPVGATVQPRAPAAGNAAAAGAGDAGFRCDGRTHCSQMRSCAEARYFLAHCPNVKMDGNRDGVPCEQQWCRP